MKLRYIAILGAGFVFGALAVLALLAFVGLFFFWPAMEESSGPAYEGSWDWSAEPTHVSTTTTLVRAGDLREAALKCAPYENTRPIYENVSIIVYAQVKGMKGDKCEFYEKVLSDGEGYGTEGKDMTCLFPMEYMNGGASSFSGSMRDYCSGPLADAIDSLSYQEVLR